MVTCFSYFVNITYTGHRLNSAMHSGYTFHCFTAYREAAYISLAVLVVNMAVTSVNHVRCELMIVLLINGMCWKYYLLICIMFIYKLQPTLMIMFSKKTSFVLLHNS